MLVAIIVLSHVSLAYAQEPPGSTPAERRARDGRRSLTDRGAIADATAWADLVAEFPLTDADTDRATLSARRVVVGVRVDFSTTVSASARLELRHGNVGGASATSDAELRLAESAFRFQPMDEFAIELGALAAPVTVRNLNRSAIRRLGATLPDLDQRIIPEGWVSYGLGIALTFGDVGLRLALMPPMDASLFTSFNGIGPGLPTTARVDVERLAVHMRLSLFSPEAGDAFSIALAAFYSGCVPTTGEPSIDVVGLALDIAWYADVLNLPDLRFTGALAWIAVDGADRLNTALGNSVGSQMLGAWFEVAYDLIALILRVTNVQLWSYIRFDWADTHFVTPTNTATNPANQRWALAIGLALRLTPGTLLKLEFLNPHDGDSNSEPPDALNFAVAFEF